MSVLNFQSIFGWIVAEKIGNKESRHSILLYIHIYIYIKCDNLIGEFEKLLIIDKSK